MQEVSFHYNIDESTSKSYVHYLESLTQDQGKEWNREMRFLDICWTDEKRVSQGLEELAA